MTSLTQTAERRLHQHIAHLTRLASLTTAERLREWLRVRDIALVTGRYSVEDAEQFADRWWIDGGF